MLPYELKHGSPRVLAYEESDQLERRMDDLNLLEEARCKAAVQSACYQQSLHRYHICNVHPRVLDAGDLVLRKVQVMDGRNKMSPKWEGPYRVARVSRPGAVRLETEDGKVVSNSWNIALLKKFYP